MFYRCVFCQLRSNKYSVCQLCLEDLLGHANNPNIKRCSYCQYILDKEQPHCPNCVFMRFKPTPYYMGFDYLYPFQNAILQFKNPDTGGTRRLRDALVYILTQNLKRQNISLPKNCCLIPMPSSQTSLHKRGFNPTYLLTQALQQHVHCQMHSTLLIRDAHKVHIKQAGLSQEARRIAVIGHYQCTVQADPDTYYFIIDDILTTGSTLNNAYDVLQEAGAKHIGAITFGRAR